MPNTDQPEPFNPQPFGPGFEAFRSGALQSIESPLLTLLQHLINVQPERERLQGMYEESAGHPFSRFAGSALGNVAMMAPVANLYGIAEVPSKEGMNELFGKTMDSLTLLGFIRSILASQHQTGGEAMFHYPPELALGR